MGDYYAAPSEDDYERLNRTVEHDPDDFDSWEALVRCVEAAEGGLNRSSTLKAIANMRSVYNRFLTRFPLLFGYWKKFADLEYSIAGTEAAEMIYERGVASIPNSVDLWSNYCTFKMETNHEPQVIRELFERGTAAVGQDFLSHLLWDAYLQYEQRLAIDDPNPTSTPPVLTILDRIIHIPMHQYARYFEAYTNICRSRPLNEFLEEDLLASFRAELPQEVFGNPAAEERALRERAHLYHMEIYQRTQTETTKRWPYESEIKRPYFHVKELDGQQLTNWRKYLEFEEAEGNFDRTRFLYERCLVACALYDEFWFRYVRWLEGVGGHDEDTRYAFHRASTIFVPIVRPAIRYHYSLWEESKGHPAVARAILKSLAIKMPQLTATYVYLAHLDRRTKGIEAGIETIKDALASGKLDVYTSGALVAEWARMVWKVKGDADDARSIFEQHGHQYLDSKYFWINYLKFELDQPLDLDNPDVNHQHISAVFKMITTTARLPPLTVRDLTEEYMQYLLERQKGMVGEYIALDRENNGPFIVATQRKRRLVEDGNVDSVNKRIRLSNGHPGIEVDEEALKTNKLDGVFDKYKTEQGEINGQVNNPSAIKAE